MSGKKVTKYQSLGLDDPDDDPLPLDGFRIDMDPPGCCRGGWIKLMARIFFVVQLGVTLGSVLQLMRAYSWAKDYDAKVWLGLSCGYTGLAAAFTLLGLCIRGAHRRGGNELYPVIYSNLASLLYLVCSTLLTAIPTSLVVVYYIYYNGAHPSTYNTDTDTHERFTLWIATHTLNAAVGCLGILQCLITVQFPFSFYLPRVITKLKSKG